MPPGTTDRIVVCGVSGSGKTTLLRTWYLDRARTALILDQTGEWEDRPEARLTFEAAETLDVLEEIADGIAEDPEADRAPIVVVAALSGAEALRLCELLIPVPWANRSVARRLGGLVVLIDEVDLIAPSGPAKAPIRSLWRRSRHAGITVLAATQRIGNVSREVTSQATALICLAQYEEGDVRYLESRLGPDAVDLLESITEADPHAGIYWTAADRRARPFTGRYVWITPDSPNAP